MLSTIGFYGGIAFVFIFGYVLGYNYGEAKGRVDAYKEQFVSEQYEELKSND